MIVTWLGNVTGWLKHIAARFRTWEAQRVSLRLSLCLSAGNAVTNYDRSRSFSHSAEFVTCSQHHLRSFLLHNILDYCNAILEDLSKFQIRAKLQFVLHCQDMIDMLKMLQHFKVHVKSITWAISR